VVPETISSSMDSSLDEKLWEEVKIDGKLNEKDDLIT
jgi:hypothetical protein